MVRRGATCDRRGPRCARGRVRPFLRGLRQHAAGGGPYRRSTGGGARRAPPGQHGAGQGRRAGPAVRRRDRGSSQPRAGRRPGRGSTHRACPDGTAARAMARRRPGHRRRNGRGGDRTPPDRDRLGGPGIGAHRGRRRSRLRAESRLRHSRHPCAPTTARDRPSLRTNPRHLDRRGHRPRLDADRGNLFRPRRETGRGRQDRAARAAADPGRDERGDRHRAWRRAAPALGRIRPAAGPGQPGWGRRSGRRW